MNALGSRPTFKPRPPFVPLFPLPNREARSGQKQAEVEAGDAKRRAAAALAGRVDAQRALDNVAKCVHVSMHWS